MADQQQYFLKWNDYQSNMVSSFKHLRNEKSFTDVTLACEGQTCKAHKMVLSACSPYFKALLEVNFALVFLNNVCLLKIQLPNQNNGIGIDFFYILNCPY